MYSPPAPAQLTGSLVIGEDRATLQIGESTITVTGHRPDELRREMLRRTLAHSSTEQKPIMLRISDHPDDAALLVHPDGTVIPVESETVIQLRPTLPDAPQPSSYQPQFTPAPNQAAGKPKTELEKSLVILVANTKGGAGKTPLAVVLAEALASVRGGDVALIDLDPTGDLSHRSGAYSATSLSKLAAVAQRQPAPSWTELTGSMEWQKDSRMWVVGAASERVSGRDLEATVQALSAGIRVFVLDSGNNDTEEVWRQAAQLADQLVVPVSWDEATVQSGAAQTTTRLYERGLRQLALRAIVVGTRAPFRRPPKARKERFTAEFERLGHTVAELPTDRHIDAGGAICWTSLKASTQAAARELASKIADRAQFGLNS